MWEVGRWVLPVITARFSLSPVVDVEAETPAFASHLRSRKGGSEVRHSSVSCDQGLLHEMRSSFDGANGYR